MFHPIRKLKQAARKTPPLQRNQDSDDAEAGEFGRREARPVHLRLAISDFSIVDTFQGFYDLGEPEIEPETSHKSAILARWEYRADSDRLASPNGEIAPAEVRFLLVAAKEDTEYSFADREAFVVYVTEPVFAPLIEAARRGVMSAELALSAELHPRLADQFLLTFNKLDVLQKTPLSIQAGPSSARLERILLASSARLQWILYVIAGLMVLILIELWFR